MTGTPFHPESNGCAESAVKTIKHFLKICLKLQSHLNKCLVMYHNTLYSKTRKVPT